MQWIGVSDHGVAGPTDTCLGPPLLPPRCAAAGLRRVGLRHLGVASALAARLQLHVMKPKTSKEHKGGSKAKRKESKEKSPSGEPRRPAHVEPGPSPGAAS